MNGVLTSQLQVLDWGLLAYDEALKRQRDLVCQRLAGISPDRLVLVEHPPVITIGRGGSAKDLRMPEAVLERNGASIFRVDRGGMTTFHGPGQLVAYPILKLNTKDLHLYLKMLLETAAEMLRGYGLNSEVKSGRQGLWTVFGKIASVGISVRRWVTYHGIALNVNTDLGWFDAINPCGDPDEKISSMARELGHALDFNEVKDRFVKAFRRIFGFPLSPKVFRRSEKRPSWLTVAAPNMRALDHMRSMLSTLSLETVCENADCPNLGECFGRGTATFMILGGTCTRRCRFCAVEKGVPGPLDAGEPQRVAMAVRLLRLKHAVITSVTRDDLPDGGVAHFVRTIETIRRRCPGVSIEILIPDFGGSLPALREICNARPEVLGHNLETVARLYPSVRPGAVYRRSLQILEYAFSRNLAVKSGIMLGLGETESEILETVRELRRTGCSRLTLGQYLPPSKDHLPAARYIPPEEFEKWAQIARTAGFKAVASGPLVRSSYHAEEMISQPDA